MSLNFQIFIKKEKEILTFLEVNHHKFVFFK